MIVDPDGTEVPRKPRIARMTYGRVASECQNPMGSLSMLDLQVTGDHRLNGGPTPPEDQMEALVAYKNKACSLIEMIETRTGIRLMQMTSNQLNQLLTPEEQVLYEEMIELQYALQRIIGQSPGPVPVRI